MLRRPQDYSSSMRGNIVNGHVSKTIWWLAWPSIIALLLQTASNLIDGAFVGRIGASALSGVGLASQVMSILQAIATAVSIGATALVARFIGADDHNSAEQAFRQSVLISVILSIVAGILTFVFGPSLLRLMGAAGSDLRLGTTYLNILLIGVTPFFLMVVLTGVYRGVGDMMTPFWVMLAVTGAAILGDYLLIFGIGPFPRLGVAGAGTSTAISRLLATVLFLALLPVNMRTALKGRWRMHWDWAKRLFNIGAPAGLQFLLRTTALTAFFAVLRHTQEAQFGTAALTIGLRMEALAFMPGFAFSVAATSMVGQNLGAKQPDRAEKSAWSATWQSIWVTSALGLVFIIFAYPIASIFTQDPNVLPLAARYLQTNGISEPFLALSMVLTGALQGAGETRAPMWSTILTQWVLRLPLTYYLAVTLGLNSLGAWISMSVTTIASGLVVLAVFKMSRWQEIEV